MKFLLKNTLIILISLFILSSLKTFATTTPLGWTILNNLRNKGRTDDEIRKEIEDLGYDANEYLGEKGTNIQQSNTLKVTATGQKIIDTLKDKGLTNNEIKKAIEDLGYDASGYFGKNNLNETNDLSIKISNKNPETNERIKLVIDINEKYTGKVYFSKLQYYNTSSEKRIDIDTTSEKYISDYGDDLNIGYTRFSTSDKGNITISKFIKFAKSGKYRIYAEDKDGNEDYVQITIDSDDKNNENSDDKNNENSENTKLSLSTDTTNISIHEPIDISIKTDNYVGKLLLYAKYRELTSSYRITLNNTSSGYFGGYSDIWEDGYYKMTSADKGKKTLSSLVEFKKAGTYRIYAEDNDGYTNFVQIYVNSNNKTDSDATTYENDHSSNSSENNEIKELLKELLGTGNSSPSTKNDIERNKENIKNSDNEIYVSRSCKQYKIEYNQSLGAFTSPDMKKNEYFVNKEYLKRYIDSKNPQKENCPNNSGWISTSYRDKSENLNNYTAPNGKVYFISQENGYFTSNELSSKKTFNSITTLKYFIRDRNPLIGMSI